MMFLVMLVILLPCGKWYGPRLLCAESELSGFERIASSLVIDVRQLPFHISLNFLCLYHVIRDYNMAIEDVHLKFFTLDNRIESEICEGVAKLRLGPHFSELSAMWINHMKGFSSLV